MSRCVDMFVQHGSQRPDAALASLASLANHHRAPLCSALASSNEGSQSLLPPPSPSHPRLGPKHLAAGWVCAAIQCSRALAGRSLFRTGAGNSHSLSPSGPLVSAGQRRLGSHRLPPTHDSSSFQLILAPLRLLAVRLL